MSTPATCRFYSPPAAMMTEPGAALADDYPYNEAFPGHSICTNEMITGGQECVGCAFEPDQSGCPGFAPEHWRDVRSVVITRGQDEPYTVNLQTRRSGLGVTDHRITEEARVLHVISTRHHGAVAPQMATQLFELEVAARTNPDDDATATPVDVTPQRRSYFAAVLS